MFVRKKRNRSGTIIVVVVIKTHGKFKEIHNLGTVKTESEADALNFEGKRWISRKGGKQGSVDLFPEEKLVSVTKIFDSISQISHDGAYRLLEKVYHSIGFGVIPDKILKDLTIARICEPSSKVATIDYIRRHWNEGYHTSRFTVTWTHCIIPRRNWFNPS